MNQRRMTEADVREAVSRAPTLGTFLQRGARRALRGEPQPVTFSLSDLDYAAQGELERLLGVVLQRTRSGRVHGELPPALREPAAWRGVADACGLGWSVKDDESVETFLERLKLLEPSAADALDALARLRDVQRQIRPTANRETWQRLFLNAARLVRAEPGAPVTLSDLGSRWLNDSKALRAGTLRRQLAVVLAALTGRDIGERELFATCGIFDNPYTSFVTLFAPVAFTTAEGTRFEFPDALYASGLACTLPAEIVGRIREVEWRGEARQLTTCENAAPFARHVAKGCPALYTEGYPNRAVQRLLRLLGQAGVTAEHEGDADLDGFRIADMIGGCLPLRGVTAAQVARNPEGRRGIPLTAPQRTRIEHALASSPQPRFADELALLLQRGCWYEQEGFDAV